MVGSSPRRIGKSDAQHHIRVIQQVLDASDPAARDAALVEGFVRFGMGFHVSLGYLVEMEGDTPGKFATVVDQAQDALLRWVRGDRLTTRADEDERRIAVAEEMLERAPDNASVAGWLARALLTLPDGHPQRDLGRAEALVRQRLTAALAADDAASVVLATIDLLDYGLAAEAEAEALYADARARLPIDDEPQLPRQLDIASLHFHVNLALDGRDGDRPERFAAQLALARARAAAIGSEASTDRRQRQSRMLYAMLLDMDESDPAGAAAAWAAVDSGAEEPDDIDLLVRYHEGRIRLSLGEYETAAGLFAPLVAPARIDYLAAIRDADVEAAGEYFSKLSAHHAYALGAIGRWDESLRALDGARSLRLRQRAGLRASRRGRTLLGLERQLYAGERGVPPEPAAQRAGRDSGDRLHGLVSRQARMFERYRRMRPELDAAALESPGIAAIAAVLGEGEAVLSLGNNFTGTIAVLVRHGDGDRPSRAEAFREWTNEHWVRLIGGSEAEPGWLYALGAPELGLDHAEVLDRLLEGVDAGLGRWIADAVRELGVRRLTVVAHRFLHLLPFWALPSLADVEVASAPSLAHLIASRAPRRRPSPRRAAIVENPTGDLPLAAAETAAVEGALAGAGFAVETFARQQAVESLVAPALAAAGVLHFGGHGRSDPARERASALLMHADPIALGLPAADPLGALAAQAADWQDDEVSGGRHADAGALGRLHELHRADGSVRERSLDYSATGTLWSVYGLDGTVLRSAELWSAGDIAVGAGLGRLGVAFLSACETGSGGFEPMIDEYGGLPAALLLAGAGAVVCSLWPVPESLTLLTADLFYRRLASAGERFDVVAAVRACGRELRDMTADDARARLLALRARLADPAARFMLEAAAWRLRNGPERPYARPVHWAAFFAVGAPRIRFAKARRGRA